MYRKTLKQAKGHAWNQGCLPGGGAQYKEGERRILLLWEEAAAGLDADRNSTLSRGQERERSWGKVPGQIEEKGKTASCCSHVQLTTSTQKWSIGSRTCGSTNCSHHRHGQSSTRQHKTPAASSSPCPQPGSRGGCLHGDCNHRPWWCSSQWAQAGNHGHPTSQNRGEPRIMRSKRKALLLSLREEKCKDWKQLTVPQLFPEAASIINSRLYLTKLACISDGCFFITVQWDGYYRFHFTTEEGGVQAAVRSPCTFTHLEHARARTQSQV